MSRHRLQLIAVIGLAGVSLSVLAVDWARSAPQPSADPASHLAGAPAPGWRQGAFSASTQTFYRVAAAKDRVWVRYETNGGPRPSQLSLMTFDCGARKVRSLDRWYSDKPGATAVNDPYGTHLSWAPGLEDTPQAGSIDAWYLASFCKPA